MVISVTLVSLNTEKIHHVTKYALIIGIGL